MQKVIIRKDMVLVTGTELHPSYSTSYSEVTAFRSYVFNVFESAGFRSNNKVFLPKGLVTQGKTPYLPDPGLTGKIPSSHR